MNVSSLFSFPSGGVGRFSDSFASSFLSKVVDLKVDSIQMVAGPDYYGQR